MPVMTMRDALNQALKEELARDNSVFLMGEEVAEYEGAYKVTRGLLAEFGPAGVLDTLVTRPRCRSGSLGVVIPLYASLESISYSCRERRKPNVA